MVNHHDTGYKELFNYPELVQQLIEGFAPPEIAQMMDFSTLTLRSGNYITPLFEEKLEDLVWSVDVQWQGQKQQVYLYLLLEFQSTIDSTMPIRLMHYVACFYDHLLKNKTTTPRQGLPLIFPIVLYNGLKPWSAKQDIFDMITPEPPVFLQPYQPHLRYYLIDEGAIPDDELEQNQSALSGVFSIEKASVSPEEMQQAVNRIVTIIRDDPNKERLDRVITRWLKRHLQRLNADVSLEQVNSLVEEHDMISENLQHWAEKEQAVGEKRGINKGIAQGVSLGRKENANEVGLKLIALGSMSDDQIAEVSGLTLSEVSTLRQDVSH